MNDRDLNLNSLYMLQLFPLLILNTMSRTPVEILGKIGNLSTNLTLVLMAVFLIKGFIERRTFDKDINIIYISLGLFTFVYVFSFFTIGEVENSYLIKLIFLFLFILTCIRTKWNPTHIKILAYIVAIFILLIFLHWKSMDFPGLGFKSIYRNPNYLAVLLGSLLYFLIAAIKYGTIPEKVYFVIIALLNLLLIYSTNSRSVILAFCIIGLSLVIMKLRKTLFNYLLYAVLLFNFFFLIAYTQLKGTWIGNAINSISMDVFKKSLFSGRSDLWAEIMYRITENPIFGFGLGTHARELTTFKFTAHNQYLQILIEVGIIGLVAFLFLLITIWKALINKSNTFMAQLSALFFIGILIYENFELTLFQNNYSIALIQWLIITMGINFEEN